MTEANDAYRLTPPPGLEHAHTSLVTSFADGIVKNLAAARAAI